VSPLDGDLSLNRVGALMFMGNLQFYCVHMLGYVNDCKPSEWNEWY